MSEIAMQNAGSGSGRLEGLVTGSQCRVLRMACALLVTAIVLMFAPSAFAESFPLSFVPPQQLPEPVRGTLQALAHKHADAMYRSLQLRIDEVDRAVGLSDEEKARLRIAAKGAVQDSLEEWLSPILSDLATGSDESKTVLLARLGGPAAVKQEQIFVQQQNVGRDGFIGVIFGGGRANTVDLKLDERDVIEHEIFTSTLASVLTDEQQDTLNQREVERTAAAAGTRMDRLMNEIVDRLKLDADQREDVTKLVKDLKQAHIVHWLEGRSGIPTREAAEFTLRVLPLPEMKRILTPAQFQHWSNDVRRAEDQAEFERRLQKKIGF